MRAGRWRPAQVSSPASSLECIVLRMGRPEPVAEPGRRAGRTVVRPVVKPVVEPLVRPLVRPVVGPVVEPGVRPGVRPVVRPVLGQAPSQAPSRYAGSESLGQLELLALRIGHQSEGWLESLRQARESVRPCSACSRRFLGWSSLHQAGLVVRFFDTGCRPGSSRIRPGSSSSDGWGDPNHAGSQ